MDVKVVPVETVNIRSFSGSYLFDRLERLQVKNFASSIYAKVCIYEKRWAQMHTSTKMSIFRSYGRGLQLQILKDKDFHWPQSLVICNCQTWIFPLLYVKSMRNSQNLIAKYDLRVSWFLAYKLLKPQISGSKGEGWIDDFTKVDSCERQNALGLRCTSMNR